MQTDFSYDLPDLLVPNNKLGIAQLYMPKTNIGGWLMVFNETPYYVVVLLGSGRKLTLNAQTQDIIDLRQGDGILYITSTQYLSVPNPPSVTIKFKYFREKPAGTYPVPLNRQTVVSDPSGNIGYSSFIIITVAVPTSSPTACGINIFNPVNSNLVFRIISALILPFGLSVVTANAAIRTDGTDNNFGGAAPFVFTHNIGGVASLSHCTTFQNVTIGAPNSFIGTWNLLDKPFDAVIALNGISNAIQLYPGQNLLIDIQNPEINSIPAFQLQWSEQ